MKKKKKTELLFESRVAASFMQSAGLSRETSNGLLEEMYGSSIDEYGDLYEVEGEEEMESPEEMEGEEAPMGDEEAPMGDEEAPMDDEEAPMEEPMGSGEVDPATIEAAVKALVGVLDPKGKHVSLEGESAEAPMDDEEAPMGDEEAPMGDEEAPMEEPMGEEPLEEMDDSILEETVRAILAK